MDIKYTKEGMEIHHGQGKFELVTLEKLRNISNASQTRVNRFQIDKARKLNDVQKVEALQ